MKHIPSAIMMMNFNETAEFKKEFKSLAKKYQSLPDDFLTFKNILAVAPRGNPKHFNVLTESDGVCVVKARLFCRYLKGSSLRIVYAYFERHNKVEFIELYAKSNRANEDRGRIRNYLKANL